MQKVEEGTWEEYKDIICTGRNGVRKAKAQLELRLVREVNTRKFFVSALAAKGGLRRTQACRSLSWGNLETRDMGKAEVSGTFLAQFSLVRFAFRFPTYPDL